MTAPSRPTVVPLVVAQQALVIGISISQGAQLVKDLSLEKGVDYANAVIEAPEPDYDVAVIGGSLVGSLAAIMLRKRGLRVAVLESRQRGQPLKVSVGEAFTEGTSVFLHHEVGLGDWLGEHGFRKFGFDFVMQPRGQPAPTGLDGCHELLLSLVPLESIAGAFPRLIPTYHVDRPLFDVEVARRAEAAGAEFLYGASVRHVELGELSHRVIFQERGGAETSESSLTCTWVLDVSGRRQVLGKQLGISHGVEGIETAAIWTRFTKVRDDEEFWSGFRGIDRRRHTIHFSGPGYWFWWIHLDDDTTSVGVTFEKSRYQPDVKAADHGFSEMVAEFPALGSALAGAEAIEPYSYYANLAHAVDHWISPTGYALIGDASVFVDALYSTGIEIACRQLVAVAPQIEAACAGERPCAKTIAELNGEFETMAESVRLLNKFKYEHAWHQPHVFMQTALYDLAEIAELYHMQDAKHWTRANLERNYRLQWGTPGRQRRLLRFMNAAQADGEREREGELLAKALLPGRLVYAVTWPLWRLPKARPYFFILTRAWGYMERLAQRLRLWPDFLTLMAGPRPSAPSSTARPEAGDAEQVDRAVDRAS